MEVQAADGLHWKSSRHPSGLSGEVVRTSRTLTFNVFTCLFCPNLCFFLRSGSRLWQKCCSKYVNSCRSCRTRSTTAPAPPTLLLPWQKSRISRCPCTQNFCQSETWHHVIQTHRLTHTHCHIVDMFCCVVALQRSGG